MISIIICSRSADVDPLLIDNIAKTIGTAYEIVNINNSGNRYSIFEAYNIGVARSQYPTLCFMHDDIKYHTPDWGQKVLKHFEDNNTGAIGIAGSPYFTQMPGSWWSGGLVNEVIIHGTSTDLKPSVKHFPANSNNEKKQVVLIDGVWMCIRKSLFDHIKFDELNFRGYHFYDIDISFQINKLGYKLYTVFDVLIQHFSIGNMNINWLQNDAVLRCKWASALPIQCSDLRYSQICEAELKTLDEYIDILIHHNKPKRSIYKILGKNLFKFNKILFYHRAVYYLVRYLKKIAGYSPA